MFLKSVNKGTGYITEELEISSFDSGESDKEYFSFNKCWKKLHKNERFALCDLLLSLGYSLTYSQLHSKLYFKLYSKSYRFLSRLFLYCKLHIDILIVTLSTDCIAWFIKKCLFGEKIVTACKKGSYNTRKILNASEKLSKQKKNSHSIRKILTASQKFSQ